MLPDDEQVFADVVVLAVADVVLAAFFDNALVTAVVAFLVDGAWPAASGLAQVVHPFWDLLFGLAHEESPFGSVSKSLPFGSADEDPPFCLMHEDPPFGSAHAAHPFELEHKGLPFQMVWCQVPLVVAACCQELNY